MRSPKNQGGHDAYACEDAETAERLIEQARRAPGYLGPVAAEPR